MSPADAGSPRRLPSSVTSTTLHLGVIEQPYRAWSVAPGKRRRKPARILSVTTGDVASILEAKYGLFSAFVRVAQKDIADAATQSIQGAIEALVMGRAVDPWDAATQRIDQRFRDFINTSESERAGIPGTPTKAALRGVSHRLKHPYRRANARRPSFRDTGLMVGSFVSWMS